MEAIVIDDDFPTVDVIVRSIDWAKYGIAKVHTAYNINGAKEIFDKGVIDIAVCDIEMPMGSGIDLIKWVREKGYDTEFIFLTSHEKFDYARAAIEYSASGYVVKPFNQVRMEAEITSALQKIREKEDSKKASQYREWYSDNLEYVETNLWEDILQQRIPADREIIEKEIGHRRLSIAPEGRYRLVIVAGGSQELIEENTASASVGMYEKDIISFLSEKLFEGKNLSRFVSYHVKNLVYTALICDEILDVSSLFDDPLIDEIAQKLGNTVTIYIGDPCSIEELSITRAHIEELDKNNVASKGKVFHENDEIVMASKEGHILEQEEIRLLLSEKKKKELLNLLKFSMENLASQKKLDAASLTEIKQDILQAVYVYLHGKEIEATRLFGNETFSNLERQATDDIMSMMRWQVYIISGTIDYVSEVEQSDSIVTKAKNYIHSHYKEDISRTEIAESVFLTPEYMAKMFKKDTGVSIKQYITDYRIGKAKELLSSPGVRISDVACDVGFDNFSYFSTVFKKTTGYTPVEYHAMVTQQNS